MTLRTMQKLAVFLTLGLGLFLACPLRGTAQAHSSWRAATASELESALPARAPVEKERIETEMRTATGIINDRSQLIGAVVLITAGSSADGKYSHYLLLQAPMTIGDHIALRSGAYAVGWKRTDDGLQVRFFDAVSGAERGMAVAKPMTGTHRVESFRIWPPSERSVIQIGRYALSYTVAP